MRVLLDTQVVVLLSGGPDEVTSVPQHVRTLLADPAVERCLSTISITEMAIKYAIGKSPLSEAHVRQAMHDLVLTALPYTTRHALQLYRVLPNRKHQDPFDRQLIAVALSEGIPLVGGDREFTSYAGLQVIW